ncbi:MAG: aquaporin [Bifidobacteriaceae bacterium]|jgi:glycerol uptake facilitator-like aquaporin|nr:aquaporin [Bifidobacteriaceae bacterium]
MVKKATNAAKKATVAKNKQSSKNVESFGFGLDSTYMEFDKPLLTRTIAEGFGSFILVLICLYGAVILPFFMFSSPQQASSGSGPVDFVFYLKPLSIVLSSALAAFITFATLSKISGGHFNPALSIASAICKKIRWSTAGLYIAAQAVGAVLATLVIRLVLPIGQASSEGQTQLDLSVAPNTFFKYAANGYGADSVGKSLYAKGIGFVFNIDSALILELLAIVIITVAFISITKKQGKCVFAKAATLGLAYGAAALITAPATAAGLNPFKTLFTSLFAQDWSQGLGDWPVGNGLLIILIQFAGAAICALVYMIFVDMNNKSYELDGDEDFMELFEIDEFEIEEAPAPRKTTTRAKNIRSAGKKKPAAKRATTRKSTR